MAFDYKKEYKEFYLPKNKPEIINIPAMNFIAVHGQGDPNEEGGAYKKAVESLYTIAYTLKMSYKNDYKIDGFFEYVVPPLEGLWWMEGIKGVDYSHKELFSWISMIHLPDFISEKDVLWAIETASKKKQHDFSNVEFFTYDEGLAVQIMHHGSYDDEPATIALMNDFIKENNYELDFIQRNHHEIYLSDPRKTSKDKLKTIIRHPIKKVEE